MSTCLVTGGAGFIGANFVRLASEHMQSRILILDLLTYAGNYLSIEPLIDGENVHFVKGSICDERLVRKLFEEYDISSVINFAAESHVDRSISSPTEFVDTNVGGTLTLLRVAAEEWADEYSDRVFVHVSTDEVYGDLTPDDPPKNEDSPYRPSSPYSASKAASDHLCRAWFVTYDFPVIVTNCSNNYGPFQFPEKLIPLMIKQAKEGAPLPIYGDGMQIRDWLHVEDHCQALLSVLSSGRPGETYCIGGDNEQTNMDVVNLICDALDGCLDRPQGTSRDLITSVRDRPGHDRRYAIDSSKIQAELGWRPEREFSSGILDTVQWYLDNQSWLEEITSGKYQDYFERQYGTAISPKTMGSTA